MRADLHIHTYYSDGLQSPDDVAAAAKRGGVGLVSVTDHDTALAYPELFSSCKKYGVAAVNGIEVSAYYKGVRLHTLGYNLDLESPEFKEFSKRLLECSLIRADDMLTKLNAHGVRLTLDDVNRHRRGERAPIHAMHVARAGAEKGYAQTQFAFYSKYLSKGAVAHSGLCRPSPEEAVEIILSCGGFPSLAHPGRIELEKQELISLVKRLRRCGLHGIEAVYSTHTQLETAYYKEMAKEYGLIVTGGSDTHFKDGGKRIGTPVFDCDRELCDRLGL